MNYQFSKRVSGLQPSAIREILKATADPALISFAAGNPAPEAFPCESVREISDRLLENSPILALQYSVTEGYTPLRKTVAKYMSEKFNVGRDFDDIIITSGAQQVMELAAKTFLNYGDTIICEDPSFVGSLNAFRSLGVKLKGIRMEADGMDMDSFKKALEDDKNVKLVYTIPNFQNPSGTCMSLEKRKELYNLCKKHGVVIIEDNPYGELRFEGENIPCIKSFDEDGLVIYAGSFSKVLSPGMRVGYAIAPREIIAKMTVCKQTEDVHTNIWAQAVANTFMTEFDFEGHLAKIRKIYKHKAELMESLLDEKVCPNISYNKIQGGLFIWATLPDSFDMLDVVKKAVEHKVAVVPGTAFLNDENAKTNSFRLNFSTPTDEQIEKGIDILAEVLNSMK